MTTLGALRRVPTRRGLTLWLHPDLAGDWEAGLPRASSPDVETLASAGRGTLLRTRVRGRSVLIRTYRRGGLLRALLPDAFLRVGRAHDEVRAVARLAPLGLAPDVLALEVTGRVLKRIRIAVVEKRGARDLLTLAGTEPHRLEERALARAVGRAVARMHEAGVAHADLHLGNVLLTSAGAVPDVMLVDLDGADTVEGTMAARRRARDVLRLCRSLDKWDVTSTTPAAVRAAFLRAALPVGQRGRVLQEGRRLQGLRTLLGRTPRRRDVAR